MNTFSQYRDRIMKHSVFKQLSWYTLGQLVVQLFLFLGIMVTSRYLGPVNVGLYSFVQNYLAAFMTLTIGMDFYFTWKVTKSENKIYDLAEYVGYKLNVTLLLTFIGVLGALFVLPGDVARMAIIMFAPLVLTSCTGFFQYAVATNNAKRIALLQILAAGALFSLKIILVVLEQPLTAFVIVNAIDTVLVATLLAVMYVSAKDVRSELYRHALPSFTKTLQFLYSIRMSLIAIALWQLILRIDQLVLATLTNAYALGIYSSAVKIAEVPNFLAGVLYTALVTHVALFANKEDGHSKRRLRQVLLLYMFVGAFVSLFVIIIAPLAVKVLYGSQFLDAIPVLRAYALSIPGMFVTFHYFGVYGVKDKHLIQSVIFVLAIMLNIGLILVLTPLYGLVGAALATAISYTLVAGTFYFHVR